MSERTTDFQLAQRLLQGVGYTALANRGRSTITAAVRVISDPGDGSLGKLEDLSLEPDAGVRTRLVFDNAGALVPKECIVNRKIGRD